MSEWPEVSYPLELVRKFYPWLNQNSEACFLHMQHRKHVPVVQYLFQSEMKMHLFSQEFSQNVAPSREHHHVSLKQIPSQKERVYVHPRARERENVNVGGSRCTETDKGINN